LYRQIPAFRLCDPENKKTLLGRSIDIGGIAALQYLQYSVPKTSSSIKAAALRVAVSRPAPFGFSETLRARSLQALEK
jgi:hypothetical protein